MKTPKEYLLENYPMFTGFVKHTLVSEMANSYAEYYHESKQSSITEVVQAKPEVCQNVIHHTCKWFDQYNGCMGCLVKKYEGKLSS